LLDTRRPGRIFLSTVERRRAVAQSSQPKGESFLQGTLDMLVLKSLQLGPMHGWGITERIESGSRNVFELNQGSLYPALYRLEKQGLIRSEWNVSENNRRARFYTLTPAGRRQLAAERANWERLSGAVNLVLRMSEG
jgi:transcriptional regulator